MEKFTWLLTTTLFIVDLAIRVGLALRVIMRKRDPSVTLAWLTLIFLLPFIGAIVYLLLGENRVGQRRAARAASELHRITRWAEQLKKRIRIDWSTLNPECLPLHHQVDTIIGVPTMPDNHLDLLVSADAFFRALIQDIDQAKSSCLMEFYIWHPGGWADQVTEALIRAAQRGVRCCLLLDSVGSKKFLRSSLAARMRRHEHIEIIEALPAGIFRALFVRLDLRNHRKIVVIDGAIGYTGSQNLVDPLFFKQDEGIGQWKDTMVRVKGPVVELMGASFLYDWMLESDTSLDQMLEDADIHPNPPAGGAHIQLVPSGPGLVANAIHDLLLTTIYAARHELLLSTPYFVPDGAIMAALRSAAQRGVRVTIILPERNDSRLVHYASRARYAELVNAGVCLMLFTGGLLHSKTITVDQDFSLIGSVNLDMRSFWLNFELTLFVYNAEFTGRLRAIQQEYLQSAYPVTEVLLAERSFKERFLENTAHLLGPLL